MSNNYLITANIEALGEGVQHPDGTRNFTKVNEERVNYLAGQGKDALYSIGQYIENPKTFDGLLEALFVVDKMADNKVEGLETLYPALSKYNNTECPEVQTMLSGIYRKTLVPDAFGPLCRMFHKQVTRPPLGYFDASEETGGAILEYLRSYGAIKAYPVNSSPKELSPVQNNLQKPNVQNYAQNSNMYYPTRVYTQGGMRI